MWWWCKHYHRPTKDPLLQSYTEEELQIEYLMFQIEEDPQQAYPRGDMGNIQFRTGDDVIDNWEKQLADGKDPSEINWDVGVDQEFLTRFKEYSKRVAERMDPALHERRVQQQAAEQSAQLPPAEHDEFLESLVGGFSDDYSQR